MPNKRVMLTEPKTCVLCGEILPAGMTAYELSGNDGEGFKHYGKCRGVLRAESDKRRGEYMVMTTEQLCDILETGTKNQRIDARNEIKRRMEFIQIIPDISAIVAYLYRDEQKDFELRKDRDKTNGFAFREDHIFANIRRVSEFLGGFK